MIGTRLFSFLIQLTLMIWFLTALVFFGPSSITVLVTASPVLLFWLVGMAFAGQGNRLAWSALFVVMAGLGMMALQSLNRIGGTHDQGIVTGIVMFAAVPVVPAFVLWTAHAYGQWRRRVTLSRT